MGGNLSQLKKRKGPCCKLSNLESYIRKMTELKDHSNSSVVSSGPDLREKHYKIYQVFEHYFQDQSHTQAYQFLREKVQSISLKDLESMRSFLAWNKEFLDIMNDENNPKFVYELENERVTKFMKLNNNLLLNLISAFDQGMTLDYEGRINYYLKQTCPNYDRIGYKKKTTERMVTYLSDIDYHKLTALESPEDHKKCISELKDLLKKIKKLANFLAEIIEVLLTDKFGQADQIKYSSTSLIINVLLKFSFNFFIFSLFLSKIAIGSDVGQWVMKKRLTKNNADNCKDLQYLNKYIDSGDKQKTLQKLTKEAIREETKGLNLDGDDYNLLLAQSSEKMELSDFLVHVNHHLKLDLDQIFFSNLDDIITFFNKIEDFMDKIFHNADLEIKIDLIKLILRVNDSSDFFFRIFIINEMGLEFLNDCQIFALFNAIVLDELKSKQKN